MAAEMLGGASLAAGPAGAWANAGAELSKTATRVEARGFMRHSFPSGRRGYNGQPITGTPAGMKANLAVWEIGEGGRKNKPCGRCGLPRLTGISLGEHRGV